MLSTCRIASNGGGGALVLIFFVVFAGLSLAANGAIISPHVAAFADSKCGFPNGTDKAFNAFNCAEGKQQKFT